jgi:uncharacterized surface protein with fasciclin (FAS1) repeats
MKFQFNLATTATVMAGLLLISPAFANHTPEHKDGAEGTKKEGCKYSHKNQSVSKLDIIDTAAKDGHFKTLATALKAAGLTDVLKGEGKFTVFAPSDAAFEALPKGTLESLLKPENKEKLVKILKFHVVSGEVDAKEVSALKDVKPLEGPDLQISTKSGVRINNAKVVKADIHSSNGIIHEIDTVLIPE